MLDTITSKLFTHRGRQAVRLPEEFRLLGKEVRVSRVGRGVLLEPIDPLSDAPFDVEAWFAKLDQYCDVPFMLDERPTSR